VYRQTWQKPKAINTALTIQLAVNHVSGSKKHIITIKVNS